jgi:predicted DNA-binding transcriptional regulator AlpA
VYVRDCRNLTGLYSLIKVGIGGTEFDRLFVCMDANPGAKTNGEIMKRVTHPPDTTPNTPSAIASYGPVYRTPAAAAYIGVSAPLLEKGRCTGTGDLPPYIQLSRRAVGYLRSDLDHWLASHRRSSTSKSDLTAS